MPLPSAGNQQHLRSMHSDAEAFLIREIISNGPMDVGTFMQFALCHPQYGYYMTRDPFGRAGDFTTAPEISQMFGEMVGAWAVDVWRKMGSPSKVSFIEVGPGRGTLMADMLRVANSIEAFSEAVNVYLMEASPVLIERQRSTLSWRNITWIKDLREVAHDAPVIIIGNEFLDALPVRQFLFQKGGWWERVVSYDLHAKKLAFDFIATEPPMPFATMDGLYEISDARNSFVKECCDLIKACNGAALFIDYGHTVTAPGDTLQAIKRHKYCDVLESIGEADLTSHVDFGAVMRLVGTQKDFGCSLDNQGDFLCHLGIEARAAQLCAKDPSVDASLQRLVGKDQMGELFKVVCFYKGLNHSPEGFSV